REAVLRVQTALLVQRFQLRQLVPVRFDKGLLIGRDVLLQRQWLILRRVRKALQRRLDLLDRDMQTGGNQGQIGVEILLLLAQQVAAYRRIVVDDDAAFAVENLAPRREHRDPPSAVLLRQHAIAGRAQYLQTPQPDRPHQQ